MNKLKRHMMHIVSEDKKNDAALVLTSKAINIWQLAEQIKIEDGFEDSIQAIIGEWFKNEIPGLARREWGDAATVKFKDDLSVVIELNGRVKTFKTVWNEKNELPS